MVMLEQGGACGNIVGGLASAVGSAKSRDANFRLKIQLRGPTGGSKSLSERVFCLMRRIKVEMHSNKTRTIVMILW
jgi:hypothetical protein